MEFFYVIYPLLLITAYSQRLLVKEKILLYMVEIKVCILFLMHLFFWGSTTFFI